MITLYRIFGLFLFLVVYPYGRIRAAIGDHAWRGRLALRGNFSKADIWIHAASVGEVRVISYLIDFLKKKQSKLRIHVTVMTRAGHSTAHALFGRSASISFLPLDTQFLQSRAVKQCNPKVLVIAETEIWPNLITESSNTKIPIILVNARMTERALGRYRIVAETFRQLLGRYDRIFCKSEEDRNRFLTLGANANLCEMAGDMKFDAPLLDRNPHERQKIRLSLGINDSEYLLVAGSTREGEEALLLNAYLSIRKEQPHIRIALAPRHLDRLTEIEQTIQSLGLSVTRSPVQVAVQQAESVLLIDRMGMLNDLYLAADLAFVGGTLVDIGGHNLLEPVWAGTPVLFGPSVGNVREAAQYILDNSFGAQVANVAELEQAVLKLMTGETAFRLKTGEDLSHSPTAHVGEYILRKLGHA